MLPNPTINKRFNQHHARNKNNKNNNNNDLKSLRNQFKKAILPLKELFPEWSQDDLLFVMDECQGDLDLAITRITEGYANQWGQVKSKKPKPQSQPQPPNKKMNNNKEKGKINE
ncbi:uncharacterized protein BX663DRAFT_498517 [Cokeromyces recurvatus]|uniref:uncharacterized protein n=1 Tax=Cokeromyces recurvatus TaxID=90255 RepID=UPI00221E43A8|nr:uncharacterized protein BX663DRAFT_498517 [Cokeromyces recurvatus]KAI7906016.1 hypothetical protein BX663DRAFT_498517 [Cokeromyces recurvatus]